jgi:hypothetical protein
VTKYADAADQHGHVDPEDSEPVAAGVIGKAWRSLDPTFLTEAPPNRRWLLRHPTRDGDPCPIGAGDGMLPLGKVGIMNAEGGAGKTNVVLALAVAIASGRRWLEHFDIDFAARRGRVFLGLAEEDEEEIHRRIYSIAQEYNLTPEERARVADQVVALPLAGRAVALIGYHADGRTLLDSPVLVELREHLHATAGDRGWSLVALDPLARWAGPDVEADNSVGTRFVQALETLTTVPGGPTVLVPHHSSKLARRNGSVDSRGVTAITDGARWASTLRADGADVYFVQSKSNYSRPMLEELRLVRGPGGLLRVPTDAEAETWDQATEERADARSRAKDERAEAKTVALEVALQKALRASRAPVTSQGQLKGLVSGDTNIKAAALARLLASGRVQRADSKGGKPRYVVADE